MEIRVEKKEEYDDIYELVKVAFETAKVSDGNEQDFVLELRKRVGYIPELALVATKSNELIGHIMFTEIGVNLSNKDLTALLLAPLAVKLEYRNIGVGKKLIEEGIKRAKELGYKAVFLVGDPEYYCRFGFEATTNYKITNRNNIPDQYVLGYLIDNNVFDNTEGSIDIK